MSEIRTSIESNRAARSDRSTARWTLALAALIAIGGCTGEFVPLPGPGGEDSPDAGAGLVSTPESEAAFVDSVQPLLQLDRPAGACAFCHEADQSGPGPEFLGPTSADNHDALLSDLRIVSGDAATSLLVTKGAHAGDAFAPDEIDTIGLWIEMH
jgi:cytochrome c553